MRSLSAIAAAACLGAALVLAPPAAEAKNRAGAVAAGALIGLAAGAIIAGSAAQAQPQYAPGPSYYSPAYAPAYVAPRPVVRCSLRDSFDRWGNYLGKVEVCR